MHFMYRRLPLAAAVIAMLALFVALGPNAIGAGGSGKADVPPAPTAHSATFSIFTATSGVLFVGPESQRTGLTATCPRGTHVTGGGVFSTGGTLASMNSSFPTSSRTWRVDYNNASTSTIRVRVYARCLRF
jgi:hypothetical protein